MTDRPPAHAGATGDRALVIMAKAPRAGNVKTRLAVEYPAEAIAALYECLLEDTVALARSVAGATVALLCPREDRAHMAVWQQRGIRVIEQQGHGLANALAFAFATCFDGRFSRVIAFNSDSPHVPVHVLENAFTLLDRHDLVVGPTEDGGYYLVGARSLHPSLFDRQRLSTEMACDSLLAEAQALRLSTALTDRCYDIDVAADLARLAGELRRSPERAPRTAALLARAAAFREVGSRPGAGDRND